MYFLNNFIFNKHVGLRAELDRRESGRGVLRSVAGRAEEEIRVQVPPDEAERKGPGSPGVRHFLPQPLQHVCYR